MNNVSERRGWQRKRVGRLVGLLKNADEKLAGEIVWLLERRRWGISSLVARVRERVKLHKTSEIKLESTYTEVLT